ncbi:MAG: hypothetical protein FGM54_03055 [Chitinophagaceae bacterium]|nr:hypothetical protein [Chitinophagaceae bacterium]
MTLKEKLNRIAGEKNKPCLSISFNTHRTHPDCLQDEIKMKNLAKEAEERVVNEFGKRECANLLNSLHNVLNTYDYNHSLDSLHLFISNNTCEMLKSSWPVEQEGVHIGETFAVRPLIKEFTRAEEYLVLVLSQHDVHLYHAYNDHLQHEIRNADFPFSENRHYITFPDKRTDSKAMDDQVKEYFNMVDKALQKVSAETGLHAVVFTNDDNYSQLMSVSDKASTYYGHSAMDTHHTNQTELGRAAWEVVKAMQHERRHAAIEEMKAAISAGKVVSDLQEIYTAAREGRGDLLIVHESYQQAVLFQNEDRFDLIDDVTIPNAVDDITSQIAWEVTLKKGRVVFTAQDDIKEIGQIVLKTRY